MMVSAARPPEGAKPPLGGTVPELPHFRFWPKGVARELVVPQATLPEYLEVAARRYPDKAAIVYCGSVVRYAELQQRVAAMSAWLRDTLKLQRGDRVLVASQNCPQFVVASYAILRAGGVVVPVNPMSKAQEVRYYAEDSGARIAFVAQELLEHFEPGLFDRIVVHAYSEAVGDASDEMPDWVREPLRPISRPDCAGWASVPATGDGADPGVRPTDLAVLPYTSGTTGHPKGCMHTHQTVIASLAASHVWKGLHCETVVLAVAPLFHMLGLQNGMNMPIFLGSTSVMLPRWNPALAARLIERHRVTAWTAPPAMILDFFANPEVAQRDISSLTLLSGGAAAMPEAVATMMQQRYGITYNEGYGLTETASFLQANPLARGKRQCLGIPAQGVDTRIVDPLTLKELPQGELGELVTHAPQNTVGYWRNPQADHDAFFELEGKRFFRTGDLAYVDEEGYFFMRDRLKRMINSSGYKVWPAEVENMLYEHPAIHEACIIGVPDARQGEAVKAIVSLKPAFRGEVQAQDIVDWARERMAVYKAPRLVEFVDALPKSGTGKILWRELQEAHRAATPQEPT
ncbi:long-chain-fatty-acid--CoA ligase [Variovorax sp. OV700]|jgi:fatty-acyl-CoA synthase|uniref:long-chain-fatty-acid--CoA ligase n=1 Tax=Variovorax sp. OV700 TaxID=1882826 RepID=UPI00088DB42F|nr:long-chain-fatty-acid--CoA ligase [Variovorax sp. OV700]SDH77322.1 fatty-acyl-CoA synthase [Variovorax sp. OV700]